MNLTLPSIQVLFFATLLVNVAFLIILAALFLLISKISHDSKHHAHDDHLLNKHVAKKIEEEAGEKLDKMITAAAESLEREIRVQLTKLVDRADSQSREMTQFVANQEEAIVKESQVMVANIVAKAEKEADVYRQNQIDKVSGQINSIVSSAAKDVLGRSISISEHEDLVSQALERAKKDKFFS